ncbi:MAG: oxidoreductase, partial [Planctomycetota bacterium]
MRLIFALVVGLIVCCAERTVAQQQRFGSSMNLTMSRFIDPPRLLRQALRDAEEAIEQEQFSEAVVKLGDLLQRDVDAEEAGLNNQDFFLDIKDTLPQRTNESFFRHCHDLIGALPDAARRTYELRYGPLAKQLLESATKTRDWEKLRAVRRKYFHTSAGYQASLLLAQRELFLGHPLSASLLLDGVVQSRSAVNQLGEELIVLHAIACRLSGRSVPSGVWEIKNPVKAGDAAATVVEDWRSWIDANYEFSSPDSRTHSTDYPFFGGGGARNETSDGQLPISSERYTVPTWSTSREEQDIPKKRDELAASGKLVPPSWSPILVGDQLLMRTTKGLFGIEHRTGKRVWPYPWYETSSTTENEDSMVPLGRGQPDPSMRLMQSVWNDVPHGQITSDGERVFFLYDLSPAQKPQINPLMGIRGNRAIDGGSNTLIALELATEGKTLWKLGKNPTVVSELNDAFFLGAPLPVDGYLYSIIEMDGDISLVCLNPSTGGLEWQQQLVANEGWGIQ